MSNESVSLHKFPSSEYDALAFLYVQNQDLTGKTPVEIYRMYETALHEIRCENRKMRHEGWFSKKSEEFVQF